LTTVSLLSVPLVMGVPLGVQALLPGQPHTRLSYILHYPDGHEDRVPVRTDGHGYSSHTLR
jgi:hypothetical protein